MPNSPRPQAEGSAAERLIDAAEALYGAHGLDGVSLRQIGVAAGSGNNYAVQYHFGDAGGLIRAILEKRTPVLERRRGELLAQVEAQGRQGDSRALMEVLYRPMIDHVDAEGRRTYARFILALNSSPAALHHVVGQLRLMPVSDHVLDLLHEANPDLPRALIGERQRLIAIMVLTSVFHRWGPYQPERFDAALIDNALDMATAAITAPVAPAVAEMMRQIGCRRPEAGALKPPG